MRAAQHIKSVFLVALVTVANLFASAQPVSGCTVKDGKIHIMLDRKIGDVELNQFIKQLCAGSKDQLRLKCRTTILLCFRGVWQQSEPQ